MTNFTHDWIVKREQLEQAAAPGPWYWEPPSGDEWPMYDESLVTEAGDMVLMGWGYDASGIKGDPADREFITDARTALPAARAALKAVLELANNPYPHFRNISGWDIINAVDDALRGES